VLDARRAVLAPVLPACLHELSEGVGFPPDALHELSIFFGFFFGLGKLDPESPDLIETRLLVGMLRHGSGRFFRWTEHERYSPVFC
jgi:hypothetical protein